MDNWKLLLLAGASLPCVQCAQPRMSYNPMLSPYQNYRNAQMLLAPRPAPPPPPLVDDGTHRVDKAIAELQRESRAWVTDNFVPGSIVNISVVPYSDNPNLPFTSVRFNYSTTTGEGSSDARETGTVSIQSKNDDGNVTAVCYLGRDSDDPLGAPIHGSYQHVIPSRADKRLLPCYVPEDIGEAQFKRAAILRKGWNDDVNQFANALVDGMLHPRASSGTTQTKKSCSFGQIRYWSNQGAIGGMRIADGCN